VALSTVVPLNTFHRMVRKTLGHLLPLITKRTYC